MTKEIEGNYMLIFSGFNPDKTVKKAINKYGDERDRPEKFFIKTDIASYESRAKAFEAFENNDTLYHHIGKSDLMKLMMNRYNNGKEVVPLVEINLIYEKDGKRLYYGSKTISYMVKEKIPKLTK
jgi:hypothetical protein